MKPHKTAVLAVFYILFTICIDKRPHKHVVRLKSWFPL